MTQANKFYRVELTNLLKEANDLCQKNINAFRNGQIYFSPTAERLKKRFEMDDLSSTMESLSERHA